MKHVHPDYQWDTLATQAASLVPEAVQGARYPLNLMNGVWGEPGNRKHFQSPVDGSVITHLPMIDLLLARKAVEGAARQAQEWKKVDLDERARRISECLEAIKTHRKLIAGLLVWEIGKPVHLAEVDVDRCISGVEWYLEHRETFMAGREPLGLVSNIASWNYPYSVLMHSLLVHMLAGNAVIAKTPTDGGLMALTVGCALAARAGLPISLVSGSGGQLSAALVNNEHVAALAFVGGKTNGGIIASSLYDRNKRYMLEMEGVNAWGIWNFSDWNGLAKQLKKGFEYGKQRCTAYPRLVIQRDLFPQFLAMYLPVLESLRFGHPLLVNEDGELPRHDFGPIINSKKVEELRVRFSEAKGKGGICLFDGSYDDSLFLPNQDISAYFAPQCILNVPRNCELYHGEPFGPLDSIVVVDRIEEMIAEMNVSGGALVSSVATDEETVFKRVAQETRAFKLGHNKVRSRGDNDEVFGGIGTSWKGCFVGGEHLIRAVTQGAGDELLFGNFQDVRRLPESR